jgi:hypothetical protein
MDQIARALLVHGARDAAIDLMDAVIARGGDERPRCEALLAAVKARPTDRVSGPPIALDAGLVEALAAQGRLGEAWAVTRGANVGHSVAGVEIVHALSLVMDRTGLPEPWSARWARFVATGSSTELGALEREVTAAASAPTALLERTRIAWRLLKGYWSAAAADGGTVSALDGKLRDELAARIAAHALPDALAMLRTASEKSPAALPVAMALARLLSAAERAADDEPRAPNGKSGTAPMTGAPLALFHLRMGNFDDAEKALRRVVMEQPADHVSRDRLADILVLRRALSPASTEEGEPLELAKTPAPDWLNKKGKPNAEGWAAAPARPKSSTGTWDEEEGATSVLRPDEEAELHVKAGHPERAIPIYELLVQRYPGKPRFQTRLAEVRALLAPKPVSEDAGDTERPPPTAPRDGGEYVLEGPTAVKRWPTAKPAAEPPRAEAAMADTAVVPVRRIVRVR